MATKQLCALQTLCIAKYRYFAEKAYEGLAVSTEGFNYHVARTLADFARMAQYEQRDMASKQEECTCYYSEELGVVPCGCSDCRKAVRA